MNKKFFLQGFLQNYENTELDISTNDDFLKCVFAFVLDIFVEFENDLIYGYIILN